MIGSLVVVITLHEYAHAWAADFLGDPTAKNRGRKTLNPLAHLDPLGTLMMFLIGIGWGKPVPVNPYFFKNKKLSEALVAVAGPIMNLLIAVVAVIPLKYFYTNLGPELVFTLATLLDISIVLFAFNMLPVPPLDGSKFLQIVIPRRWQGHYEEYLAKAGIYFAIFLLLDNLILARYLGFSVVGWVVGWVVVAIKTILFLGS